MQRGERRREIRDGACHISRPPPDVAAHAVPKEMSVVDAPLPSGLRLLENSHLISQELT